MASNRKDIIDFLKSKTSKNSEKEHNGRVIDFSQKYFESLEFLLEYGRVDLKSDELINQYLSMAFEPSSDNIYKVKDCLSLLEDDAHPSSVIQIIKSVTGRNPECLIQDGESRIDVLRTLISEICTLTNTTITTLAKMIEDLHHDRELEEGAYNKICEKYRNKCLSEIYTLNIRDKASIDIMYSGVELKLKEISNLHNTKLQRISDNISEAEDLQFAANIFRDYLVTDCEKRIYELKFLISKISFKS